MFEQEPDITEYKHLFEALFFATDQECTLEFCFPWEGGGRSQYRMVHLEEGDTSKRWWESISGLYNWYVTNGASKPVDPY